MASAKNQVKLFSKGDIADMMGITSQALSNRAGRDEQFPKPTYVNVSGQVALYTADDVKAIHEYLRKEEQERLDKLTQAIGTVLG
jgi:hypothetical protein